MNPIKFQINYHTVFGQDVYVCGSIPELGDFDEDKALRLTHNGEIWTAEIDLKTSVETLQYYYLIRQQSITVRRDWGRHRRVTLAEGKTFLLYDMWKDKPYHSYLYSSVFSESVFFHPVSEGKTDYFPKSVLLQVVCPFVRRNQRLALSGESDALGNWDVSKAPLLRFIGDGEWEIALDAKKLPRELQYKFVIVDENNEPVYWEEGGNRILQTPESRRRNFVKAEIGLQFHYNHFYFKGSGTVIPVFSLRSDTGFGIGDFLDLKKMIDWAAVTNQQIIQTLPINDTTATRTRKDSYPYSAISNYALHPIYLGLSEFPLTNRAELKKYREKAAELNSLEKIDYERALRLKTDYTRQLFGELGAAVLSSEEYKLFYDKNRFWLFSYACFCYLRDLNRTTRFEDWGEYAVYDEEKLRLLIEAEPEAKRDFDYHCFLQFLLDRQLCAVQQYAHAKGVALKGDIPIGISRNSVDAWTSPQLFNLDTQAGAPPDDFSFFGQNWGFPTYNWAAMESENYTWWEKRFRKMSDFFDAYRIDHILGFFRIWEIPADSVQGLLGYFSPALPYRPEELNMNGIPFDEERMTKPFIHEGYLHEVFGEFTPEVTGKYLEISGWQQFRLKKEVDTQRKIQQHFSDKKDAKSLKIRDGLYALCNEVLFVRDRLDGNRFHPRITAQYTYSYNYLDDRVKSAFNRLYDDFYYHRHNYFWREQAMKKLPRLISSTSMMVCGEDLGMVPASVPSLMSELQILSLEIQRMPKDPHTAFTDLDAIPYLSVCTTSTHDMSPLRLWWQEDKRLTRLYYNDVLHHDGEAPDVCTPQICKEIIREHLRSAAMWVILPWQDWMALSDRLAAKNISDERINIPSDPEHYWRYRMHLSLDALLKETDFNDEIKILNQR